MNIPYQTETWLQGIPISAGKAMAKICLFNEARHANLPVYQVSGEGLDRECSRLNSAIQRTADQLAVLHQDVARRIGKAEAEIFSAQIMILQDVSLRQKMTDAIRVAGHNAEMAVALVLEVAEARLMKVDNEYIQDRATDIGEIKRRLLDALGNLNPALQCAGQPHCQKGRQRVVVAEELTPTLTLQLDTAHTRGFVTERGGKTSHAAILARALGIPAVTGIKGVHAALTCGTDLLINGDTGEVVVWPSAATVRAMLGHEGKAARPAGTAVAPVPGFHVMANITLTSDVPEALAMGAEGIGLYRTEFEFFAAGHLLTEDEQVDRYVSVVRQMAGKPVTIRLLDVGGDKAAPYFEIPPEQNPCLGFRGSRLLLARPELLNTQARALARASKEGPIRVLYPMIIDVEQFVALKRRFGQAIETIDAGELTHGAMFETPSACLLARELLTASDFASVGTNDLIQYLFAVDRNNESVAYDYSPDRPVFWELLALIVRHARELNRPLSICGEIAGDPQYVRQLKSVGVTTVSASARLIAGVRRAAAMDTPASTKTE